MEVVPGCYQVVPEVPAFPDDYDDDDDRKLGHGYVQRNSKIFAR